MEKLGYFIKKDNFIKDGDLSRISFSDIIMVAKDKASYVVFKVMGGAYMDTPYRGDYNKSKITAAEFKRLFTGDSSRYISFENAINDESTILVAREYFRDVNYPIKSDVIMPNGSKIQSSETTFSFQNNCVLVAELADGRCVFDVTNKNLNTLIKSSSRVPAYYFTVPGYNPKNTVATLGEEVEGYTKENIIKVTYSRPAASNHKGNEIEFGNE